MKVGKQVFLLLVVLLLCAGRTPSHAQVTDSDRKLVTTVFSRLVSTLEKPARYKVWPPLIGIEPKNEVNAYSALVHLKAGGVAPAVIINAGTLHQAIEGQPDRLAFILGHELGHVMLGHILPEHEEGSRTILVRGHFSRQDEFDADHKGMQIALEAGYPFTGVRNAVQRMIDLGIEYSPIEGLTADHPAWSDRLARLDSKNADFWRSMSAFNDGVALLTVEQYEPAATCFQGVVSQFPDAPEAWANLGYAYLMQYCDQLDKSDIKNYDIGYIVCGGFFRRLKSQTIIKGINADLWDKATNALQVALSKVKDDPSKKASLALIKSNLGLAYLVSSSGKPDRVNATRYLQEAAAEAQTDNSMDTLARAAVLINAGVSTMTAGQSDAGSQSLESASRLVRNLAGNPQGLVAANSIGSALLYNRSLVAHGKGDMNTEADLLDNFLSHTSDASLWYDQAYDRYLAACRATKRTPVTKAALIRRQNEIEYKPLLFIAYPDGVTVRLAQQADKLDAKLGAPVRVPTVAGRGLVRMVYASRNLTLLATDEVLAIRVQDPSVELPLTRAGVGGKKVGALKVGMKAADLDTLLGASEPAKISIDDPNVAYQYYRDLGVAAHVEKGVVTEFVVVQVPDTGEGT